MYQVEHDEMFAAIRAGKPINNGEQAANSTLLAIMGRMAAYTGPDPHARPGAQFQARHEPRQLRVRPQPGSAGARARDDEVYLIGGSEWRVASEQWRVAVGSLRIWDLLFGICHSDHWP